MQTIQKNFENENKEKSNITKKKILNLCLVEFMDRWFIRNKNKVIFKKRYENKIKKLYDIL